MKHNFQHILEFKDFRDLKYQNFKYKRNLHYHLCELDKKKFNDVYGKHKWYTLNNTDKENFKNNLFTLVNISYDDQGGHVRINSPNTVVNDHELTFWTAVDIDNNPYADFVVFGRKTKFGTKISGFGTDGQLESVDWLIKKLHNLLSQKGFYVEACGEVAKILLRQKTPYVQDIKIIRRIFNNPNIKYIDRDHCWYMRKIKNVNTPQKEILFGIPFNLPY